MFFCVKEYRQKLCGVAMLAVQNTFIVFSTFHSLDFEWLSSSFLISFLYLLGSNCCIVSGKYCPLGRE